MPGKSKKSKRGGGNALPTGVVRRQMVPYQPGQYPQRRMNGGGQCQMMQKGGMNASSSGSAWQYVQNQVGDANTQYNDTFKGPTNDYGNAIRSLGGTAEASYAQTNISKGPYEPQSGGRKSRRSRKSRKSRKSRSRSKRGGFFGSGVIETAAVPFGLFAAQHYYGKKSSKNKNKTRRTRKM
jgi:hypothetical protein